MGRLAFGAGRLMRTLRIVHAPKGRPYYLTEVQDAFTRRPMDIPLSELHLLGAKPGDVVAYQVWLHDQAGAHYLDAAGNVARGRETARVVEVIGEPDLDGLD